MARPAARGGSGYSGTPLPAKLGIREGAVVVLKGAPADFERTLGRLPAGVTLRRTDRGARAVTVWFLGSQRELRSGLVRALANARPGKLWLAWPKKASGVETDLTENVLREVVLPTGWVDVKVCAIDATWSGLMFSLRRQP